MASPISFLSKIARYSFVDIAYLGELAGAPIHHLAEFVDLYYQCSVDDRRRIVPFFEPDYYLANNLDVQGGQQLPLEHFLVTGVAEWRNPHPLIDLRYIAERRSDLFDGEPTIELLLDCLEQNLADPSPFFSIAEYRSQSAVVEPNESGLIHFLSTGADRGLRPNPYFDAKFYCGIYEDVPRSGLAAFLHFLERGDRERRVPSSLFDPVDYIQANDDVVAVGMGPLEHYLRIGRFQDRTIHPYTENGTSALPISANSVARSPGALVGFVDAYSYHSGSNGWIFWGWVPKPWGAITRSDEFTAHFSEGDLKGYGTAALFRREDLGDKGIGLILHLPSGRGRLGELLSIVIENRPDWVITVTKDTAFITEQTCTVRLRELLPSIEVTSERTKLLNLIGRRGYSGVDTLESLGQRVFFSVDENIMCPPDGVLLIGWYLADAGVVREIRLRSGSSSAPLAIERLLRMPRPDVLSGIGNTHGFTEVKCGFMVWVDNILTDNNHPYVEIEMTDGEVAYRNLPPFRLGGLSAMQRILGDIDCLYEDIKVIFDSAIGPSIEAINKARLATRPKFEELTFGKLPQSPKFSVIIPLYGRIDYLEYQMAFLSRFKDNYDQEFIYVLDDPAKRRELIELSFSVHRRFGIPFRLVILSQNVGFAPANNIGATFSRGEYYCFLNSDVFPGTSDWLERLAARLVDNSGIGIIGPRLLYEDGSIQHEGMELKCLPEFGNWHFPTHVRKGQRPHEGTGLQVSFAITAACMMLRQELLAKIGGFDEAYAIGDFEDADLCMKVRELGLECAVDTDVTLYHLERKSQAASSLRWRMNLTLYNAWVYESRWGQTLRTTA